MLAYIQMSPQTEIMVPLRSRRLKRAQLAQKITGDHLVVGGRPFRRFTAQWDEIAEIHPTERDGVSRTRSGRRRRIDLSDLENAAAVRDALLEAQRRLAP